MSSHFSLSAEEQRLVEDSSWLMAKQRITGKVYGLFGQLCETYQSLLEQQPVALPAEITTPSAKIYKGEQYLNLPYVMLDFPRCFGRNDTFAVRSFFWWGHHFSIHLLLTGRYEAQYRPTLLEQAGNQAASGWYLGVGADPWQHHFNEDNYLPLTHNRNSPGNGHLKLGKWLPLQQWDQAGDFFCRSFEEILSLLNPENL